MENTGKWGLRALANGEGIHSSTRQRKRDRQACVAGGEVVAIVLAKWLDSDFLFWFYEAENTKGLEVYKIEGINSIVLITIKKPVKIYRFNPFGRYRLLSIFQNFRDMEDGY